MRLSRAVLAGMAAAMLSAADGGRLALASGPLPKVRLRYERKAGAEPCPDEATLRAAVAARLGYEPFDEEADTILNAIVSKKRSLLATLDFQKSTGEPMGSRKLSSREADCRELSAAMVLAISITVDPQNLGKSRTSSEVEAPREVSPPLPQEPKTPQAEAREVSTPPVQEPKPIVVETGLGLRVGAGQAPSTALGLALEGKVRRSQYSLALEGRADSSLPTSVDAGQLNSSLLGLSLIPCREFDVFSLCLLGTVGLLRAEGKRLPGAQRVQSGFAMLGGRIGFEFPLFGSVSGRLEGDFFGNLARTTFLVGERAVWSTSPVGASLGLKAVMSLR